MLAVVLTGLYYWPATRPLLADDALTVAVADDRHFGHDAAFSIAISGGGGVFFEAKLMDAAAQTIGLLGRRDAVTAANLTHEPMQAAIVSMH